MASKKEEKKAKTIKAGKEKNWLVITVLISFALTGLLILLAFLAHNGIVDFEGTAEVVFDPDGNPYGVIDRGEVRVMDIQGEGEFMTIRYYTISNSLSRSEVNVLVAEGGYYVQTLDVDTGYELGKPPYEPLRLDGDMINFIILAMIPPFALPGLYIARFDKNIRLIEDRLPDFLRDVAEAGRFGMTLADAIMVASKGRYGRLTPEIKKMASRIEWGVTSNEAILRFSEKVKTPLVKRVSAIVIKSNDAGGNVADVLTLVANDTKEIQLMDKERRLSMSTYIAVIYIAFFVFIFTIIILNSTFLPQMRIAGEETAALMAETGAGGADTATVSIIQVGAISAIQFTYLIATLAHAIGDGLIAGALSSGKIKNGLVHSFILLVFAFLMLRLM
jgi:flagellar protein FlaJ